MDFKVVGDGEPLVLIHGLGQTYKAWKYQEELSDTYQLILPNLRGHGNSSITQNITLESFAKDVITMLDDLNIESAHIGGLSMGGLTAQALYRKAPHRVKSMILANTTSYVPYCIGTLFATQRKWNLCMVNDEMYIKQISRGSLYNPSDLMVKEAMETFKINRTAYNQAVYAAVGINFLPMLSRAEVPIQIISSTHDMVTPYAFNGFYMQNWASRARSTVFNRTGHLSNIQRPGQFNQVVRDFLEEV